MPPATVRVSQVNGDHVSMMEHPVHRRELGQHFNLALRDLGQASVGGIDDQKALAIGLFLSGDNAPMAPMNLCLPVGGGFDEFHHQR